MEDLSALRSVDRFEGCSLDDARLAVENVARLHAKWWDDRRLAGLDWLGDFTHSSLAMPMQEMYLGSWKRAASTVRELSPPGVYEIAERYGPKLAEMWTARSSSPLTLNHGDYHLANVMFRDDEVVSIDWQLAHRGPAAVDVAYFITGGLSVEDRRSHEESLLDSYLAVLREGGVRDYSRDQLIHDYRFGMFRTMMIRVGVIANLDVDNETGRNLVEKSLARAVAYTDWDCGVLIPD